MSTQLNSDSNQPIWVIIDANVNDLQLLVEGVIPGTNVFVLDAKRNGIEQITELLQTTANLPQSLHIISHGAPGTLYLGNSELSLDNLESYAPQLSSWIVNQLLFYGCNVAAGDAGEEFITKLNALTGAYIAASTSPVGSAVLGGNWNLDATTHNQPVKLALESSATAHYSGVLATLPDVENLFNLNNDAERLAADLIRLAPAVNDSSGSAFSRARIDFDRNWNFRFDLFFGDDDEGADGIGFVLHNDPEGADAIGNLGGGLALVGVENSVAIEFDTFQNVNFGDPVADHTAFVVNIENDLVHGGDNGEIFEFASNIEDGTFHEVSVSWDVNSQTLSYTFDGEFQGTLDRDVIGMDFGGASLIYWGFGAATGDRINDHQVRLIGFNGRLVDESGNEIIDTEAPSFPFPSPIPLPEGFLTSPLVFQFRQFVEFEEIDERTPYQGDEASFNEDIYLARYPDIRAAVEQGSFESGFEHFTLLGADRGRSPLPLDFEIGGIKISSLFDETFYRNNNQDVDAAVARESFIYGFDHFLKHGIYEGRDPSYYYDEALYLNTYADVREAVGQGEFRSGLEHYLYFGHAENRTASEIFDPNDYLLNNADVAAAVNNGVFTSALHHYLEFGAAEGRVSTLLYEEYFYLQNNPDVADAVESGLFETGYEHYVLFGQREGRNSGPLFNESIYLNRNPDVAAAVSEFDFSSGMEQFFRHGRDAGRPALIPA